MKSFMYRNDPLFLRNEFETDGKWEIPLIKKRDVELSNVNLIAISDTKYNDREENRRRGVHFFVDDYKFENVYKNPERAIVRLSQYSFVLTPDFSTYSNMNYWRQLESVAHSRWCGAFWQDQGMSVIPTVSWSTSTSFDFCFDGIEEGSIVAVGMIGCKHSKKEFLYGYDKMLTKINPSTILCFGSPFEEMEGNIVAVDYIKSRRAVR
ncbi:DUF4417 domain-containing protein [Falcatimonas sp. MSJ-15]|uniref:DUF4417 domain-containing protein n=1 Tax=Falcatimonas sp. MSJ-15 TaxID=2841515 RepID=UPI001C100699|nr:DUF4417 domain-containing protein [Falcatimonas sp. MSJ-15]MBU5469812.1 DUF4417 domain-containing protein [Falcatimonas sp. MSJ-15]